MLIRKAFVTFSLALFGISFSSVYSYAGSASGWESGNTIGVSVNSTGTSDSKSGSHHSSSGNLNGCSWTKASQAEISFFKLSSVSSNGYWEMEFCPNPANLLAPSKYVIREAITTSIFDFVWVNTYNSVGITGIQVAQVAEKEISIPSPNLILMPSFGVVNLKELFGINPATVTEKVASASLGDLSASVWASPMLAEFYPGDGNYFNCSIEQVVSSSSGNYMSDNLCSYVYKKSSYGASFIFDNQPAFQVKGCVLYAVKFLASDGENGYLNPLEACSYALINIGQIQSILVGP